MREKGKKAAEESSSKKRRRGDDNDESDEDSIPGTPSGEEGSSEDGEEEQQTEREAPEGSQFELRQREDPSPTPTSPIVTPPTRISLQSIYEFLVFERDARMRAEALLREERDARFRFKAMMREERTQVRTLLRELSSQFEVMAGQIEQITVFLRTAQSMHTLPPSHREDPLSTDPHTSTSRGVGTSLDPPTTDAQLPVVPGPILESSATLPMPQ